MAYIDQWTTAQDPTFQHRVQTAVVTAAQAITNESNTTTNHSNRSALATQVARNPETYAALFAKLIVQDATITTGSTDTSIFNAVSACWNCMAGGL